jgi:8-oxo-dGTP pyrophosphatase MutT (NUDIX family)
VPEAFLRQLNGGGPRLRPSDAVAALLLDEKGRYIMQRRDEKDGIFYPGHWGCFGGAVESGESPLEALRRELREELELEIGEAERFTQIDFDFAPIGHGKVVRVYFETRVSEGAFRSLVLHEGAELGVFAGDELLDGRPVTPYDAFAVWMHAYSRRSA